MISNKLYQLKQDILEVKDKFEEITLDVNKQDIVIVGCKDLKEAIEMLDEHLKDHIEDVEIFIGRTS
jgi:NADH/NAD ratio-sensing transcriptional regulator Rex